MGYSNLKSNRKNDTKQEKIINAFLDEFYFKKIFPSSQLVFDRELQIAGADVQFKNVNNEICYIDIKAQSSKKYINNPRPTYILELSSINKYGEAFVGWFLNEDLVTDYYTFVWIPEARVNTDNKILNPNDIIQAEVMTVSKKSLKEYILKVLGDKNLDNIIDYMRKTEKTKLPLCKGIHFSHTPTLYEKPVNIVVQKSILKKFAINHYIVKQDSLTKL